MARMTPTEWLRRLLTNAIEDWRMRVDIAPREEVRTDRLLRRVVEATTVRQREAANALEAQMELIRKERDVR